MTIAFQIRTLRSIKSEDYVPIYIRVVDGRSVYFRCRTNLEVRSDMWDEKNEKVKARVVCPDEERKKIDGEIDKLRAYVRKAYNEDKEKGKVEKGWLEKILSDYYEGKQRGVRPAPKKDDFDTLFDRFLAERKPVPGRRKHYDVLRRLLLRYSEYVRLSKPGKKKYAIDVKSLTTKDLNSIYDYIVDEHDIIETYPDILKAYPETRTIGQRGGNTVAGIMKNFRAFVNWCVKKGIIERNPFDGFEKGEGERYGSPYYLTLDELKTIYAADFSDKPDLAVQRDIFVFQCNIGCRVGDLNRLTKKDIINGALEYIPNKTIKENAKTVVVPLNTLAKSIVDKYKDLPGESLLPFISSQNYNYAIKDILAKAEVTRLVTILDPLTRTEVKKPINEVASSHMARRTFIGNIYKEVKDQHLVSSLTGHSDNSRAFARYRNIDIDMKKDLVNILEK